MFHCFAKNAGAYHREDEYREEEYENRFEAEWFFQQYSDMGYRVQIIEGKDITTEIEEKVTTAEHHQDCHCRECRNARKG
jgi:hypothetical protein